MTTSAAPTAEAPLDMDRVRIDPGWALRVPATLALRRLVLPFAAVDQTLYVACADPSDAAALLAVERHTGLTVIPRPAEPDSLRRALARVFPDSGLTAGLSSAARSGKITLPAGGAGASSPGLSAPTGLSTPTGVLSGAFPTAMPGATGMSGAWPTQVPGAAGAPGPGLLVGGRPLGQPVDSDEDAVALTEDLLRFAVLRQASDIHVEPDRDGLRIRLRVDGVLEHHRTLPVTRQAGVLSRFKVLAGLDIAEKRAPQDGGFTWSWGPPADRRSVDIRVATLPVRHGERMTLRLLALQTQNLTLERLGMGAGDLERFRRALARPHGIILLTGPTGSGKSTTLYAALRTLDRAKINILTIEDPIEYEIAGAGQVEVDSADKVTFGKALRSALRHDPDVLMIGEVRDLDTAEVAIKASLTGHLVLSTLHTNSAVGAMTRLLDMGVPEYLVAATLRLSVAQRLVRRLCASCRKPAPLSEAEAKALGRPEAAGAEVFQPAGCPYCGGSGYSGRVGVFELVAPDAEMQELIAARAPEAKIAAAAAAKQMRTLRDDALDKVLGGMTSPAEAMETVELDL